ncbi:enoyl-CoA hydratase/isomerase family protein [Natrialba sp. INN-245]|uniref:enoyl-CoA hydratase-related protein n=1 Tax=Natrialba sp. INN-245 TaxID=2690967 RepID=UPI00130F8A93|nr:enoyl-CoA hydratase/isomerase family protein [Natrialba sp. INN-245]
MSDLGPYRSLSVAVDDGIATVTIDRPDVLNALDTAAVNDLDRAFDELALRPEIDAIVLTGAGDRAFSSGADVSEYETADERYHRPRSRQSYEMVKKARSVRPPTIARIDGYCLGGGLTLAMYCDLRIASETAEFGVPTTRIGQIPGGGVTYRLVELVGEAGAKEIVLLGDRIDADRARTLGLVNRVVPAEELEETVDTVTAAIQNAEDGAAAAAKASINQVADETDRAGAFAEETDRWLAQYLGDAQTKPAGDDGDVSNEH